MRIKKLLGTASLAGVTMLAATAAPASAGQGLHWFQGQTPTIVVTNGSGGSQTATANGQVAGAGTYIIATLTANYSFPTTCFNGGNDQGPVPGKTGTGSASSGPVQIQAFHGNATITNLSVTVSPPATVDAATVCKNHGSGWTATAGPITITSATLNVNSSNGGTLSYTQNF